MITRSLPRCEESITTDEVKKKHTKNFKIAVVVKFEGTVAENFVRCSLYKSFKPQASSRVLLLGWNTRTNRLYKRGNANNAAACGKRHQLDALVCEARCNMVVYCPVYTVVKWSGLIKLGETFSNSNQSCAGWVVGGPITLVKNNPVEWDKDNAGLSNAWDWITKPWLMVLSLLFFVDWLGKLLVCCRKSVDTNNACNTLYFEKLYTHNNKSVIRAPRSLTRWKFFGFPNYWRRDPYTVDGFGDLSFLLRLGKRGEIRYACKLFQLSLWYRSFVGVAFYAVITWYPIFFSIVNWRVPTVYYWLVSALVAVFCYALFPCEFAGEVVSETGAEDSTTRRHRHRRIYRSIAETVSSVMSLGGICFVLPISINVFGIPLLLFLMLKEFLLYRIGLVCLCPNNFV